MDIENKAASISPAGALGTAAISSASGFGAQLLANRANRKMAEYQYSKDLEMWNRQNEYNSPINQMLRFKEAGLNPNLIYGKGTAGNATTLPKYSAPTISHKNPVPDGLNTLSQYYGIQNMQAQNDVLTQNARLAEEKVLTESYRRAAMNTATGFQNWRWKVEGPKNLARAGIMHDKKAAAMGQQWSLRSAQQRQINQMTELAKYNTKIAEQNMLLKIKDNQYYFWKNVGSGIGKGIGNMFRFGAQRFKIRGGKAPKLKTPRLPTRLQKSNSDILPNYNFYN